MKSVYLIDGGFFRKLFSNRYRNPPTSKDVIKLIKKINEKCNGNQDYLRIYYYDCFPSMEKITNPISNTVIDLSETPQCLQMTRFLNDLKREDLVAVREGNLISSNWRMKKQFMENISTNRTLTDQDIIPDIKQKGVDIKIGLDIAWISLEKIVDRILLITGDSDFIPAIKFARRSGIQVFLFNLGWGSRKELLDNADIVNTKNLRELLH